MKLQIAVDPRIIRVRPNPLVVVLAGLMCLGFVVAMIRFASGIGAISNLSNTYPWGFWISFDIFTGIAISSGAFLVAAAVYILDLREFRPLLMPSVLTALLGYLMEALALMVDLGRPERIFSLLIHQNYTSHMLVVGLCVMLYLLILTIEFAPVLFKGIKQPWLADSGRKLLVPAVILGVVISTIHQGSLGSLLLIQSAKLHPLWWTPLLPVMFFVSSIPIGLAMLIFESSLAARYFDRGLDIHLLEKLARAIPVVLAIYIVLKFGQLALAGNLGYLFTGGLMSLLFWIEITVGSVIPLIIFSSEKKCQSPRALLFGAVTLLLGMVLNRFNVSWLGIHRLTNISYSPSLMELSISVAIFSFGFLAFGLAARYLPLFEDYEDPAAHPPSWHAMMPALMRVTYEPIGVIHSPFKHLEEMPIQPTSANSRPGTLEIYSEYVDGLKDLGGFSHIYLLYHFHQTKPAPLLVTPFLDTEPRGVFATRAPTRPNPIGLSLVKIERIEGNFIHIVALDILDETPLLDIKPYVPQFENTRAARIGWLAKSSGRVRRRRSDERFK